MKHSPVAKEQKDKHDEEDHNVSSKLKDQPRSNKDNKCNSNKNSSSTTSQENCKHGLSLHASSLEGKQKVAHIDNCSSSGSPCARHRSLSKSMGDLNDHVFFSRPSPSTPYKPKAKTYYSCSSTDSRCSWTPMDSSLYNSFNYYSPMDFGRGGVTPAGSVAKSQHVSSSMLDMG